MWLDLTIAMSCGGAGLVCGWIMHATGNPPTAEPTQSTPAKSQDQSASMAEVETNRERIGEVAEHLRAFARSMAADVDAHQTTVQAVSNRLTADQSGSPEAVFQAINQLIESNELMQSQLHSAQDRIQDQAVQIESAERRAETDALTRVPNRGAFDKHLHCQHSLGSGKAGTLAILDVDHFKKFNDVYGHRAGDEVLRVVANILHSRLNKYGIVARFGGEEFAILLDGYSVDQAKNLVDDARAAIGEREIPFEDKRLRVTASAGVAELMNGESAGNWLQRADDGLYRSKESGRDCGHWMDGTTPIKIEIAGAVEAPESERPAARAKPFGNLPGRESLAESFDEVRGRTQSSVSIFVMAIRCNSGVSNTAMRSLMQIVKATLRSVDQLGSDDPTTFLVLMPSIDEATAHSRSLQICRSASAIGLGKADAGSKPVRIGISEARRGEDFEDVVERCIDLADHAEQESEDGVMLESAQQAV